LGKTAFENHGELNVAINEYVGNALNVIPTWLNYEAYATNQEEPVVLYGDVDSNGVLDSQDAALVFSRVLNSGFILGASELADVDNDGAISSNDSSIILQKVLNSDFLMPIENKK